MPKKEVHIVDWILDKTNFQKQKEHYNVKKRASSFDNRKIKFDDMIYLCKKCDHTWSAVPKWIDASKWRSYPLGNIPTLGKKRKTCPGCK
tara:strand:- start:321 stop:590 length:270 start_codon:yes stop_codon:yes gene_type:complete